MAEPRKFEIVADLPDAPPSAPRNSDVAAQALILGLGALSQRALAGGKAFFTLLSVGSAWWLWAATRQPDVYQIVSLSIYAAFILAMNWIVWRK